MARVIRGSERIVPVNMKGSSYMSPELDMCIPGEDDDEDYEDNNDDDSHSDKYSFNTDIWSLGCVLYEVIYLKLAFRTGISKTKIPKFKTAISGRFTPILSR